MNPAPNVATLPRPGGGLALLKTNAKFCGGEWYIYHVLVALRSGVAVPVTMATDLRHSNRLLARG